MTTPRLVVNADDFGFTRGVNEGIVACHRDGILTATTLMANGPAFAHAVELARENPALDVGCHLVLVQGPGLPRTISELLWALARRKIDIYGELKRQMDRVLEAGIRPTHLDTHKHTHLAPPVLDAVIRLAREYGVEWVRKPADSPQAGSAGFAKRVVNAGVRALASRFDQRLARAGLRTTDHFTGFQMTGVLDTPRLVEILNDLPDGTTELMCHPGFLDDDLRAATTRLKESRAIELRALTSSDAKEALARRGIRLTAYEDLKK